MLPKPALITTFASRISKNALIDIIYEQFRYRRNEVS